MDDSVVMAGWRAGDVAMLVTTYARLDPYTPAILESLDRAWPAHPIVRVVTDGADNGIRAVTAVQGLNWVDLLLAGLLAVREAFPQASHVFHMLDDHCPLRRVDASRMGACIADAVDRNIACVAFPTYRWPWTEISDEIFDDNRVRTWRRIETTPLGGGQAAVVPRDFFRYFQVQPSLWRLNYLIAACEYARSVGVGDAWAFEALEWPGAEQHLVADYDWPTVHHGFLAQGKINPDAIGYVDRALLARLYTLLLAQAGIGNRTVRALKRTSRHVFERVRPWIGRGI